MTAETPKLYMRGHNDDGTPWMGTADERIADLQHCLDAETRGHNMARRNLAAAREQIAALTADRDSWAEQDSQHVGELVEAMKRVAELEAGLRKIERWFGEFPPSGKFWDNGAQMSYGAAFGSNGERDYMRGIARALLAPSPEPKP